MRLQDLGDYLRLRRFLIRPWAFLRLRKHPPAEPFFEVALRDGTSIRLRTAAHDRHVLHRVFARDEYRLNDVPPGSYDTVIDVGGHIGTFAIRASGIARRVLCFEPTPESYELLSRNVARHPNVTAFPLGVAGRRGTMTLHVGVSPSRNSMFPSEPERSKGTLSAETVTLEDIFREQAIERCDLLKIDCEGAEYDILYATPKELWPRIARTCLEYHPVAHGEKHWTGEHLLEFLAQRGHAATLHPSAKDPRQGLLFSTRR